MRMQFHLHTCLRSLVLPMVALIFGVIVTMILVTILGESPFHVLYVLLNGALGSPTGIGYSLYYASPLLLTGLAVAWAFRAGLFNIGAEGQMMLGGLTMAASGILTPNLPSLVAIPLALAAAFVVGGLWGALAGWLKARRGCHEVLTTILLNSVAYGISSFFILTVLRNREGQVPETEMVGDGFQIPPLPLTGGSPLNWSLLLGLVLLAVYGFVMRRTRFGFWQRMVGGAPEVGRRAGVPVDRQIVWAMFISGGIAALAAASPILGFAFKAREGFTANAGFVGVAVALLGRGTPVGIAGAALLFGILSKGALDLDLDTQFISRDLALVIQALIIVAVASQVGLTDMWLRLRDRWRSKGATHGP